MTHDSHHRRAPCFPQTRSRWSVAAPLLLASLALLTQDASAQTVVLRDSIGPDATWTNGRRTIAITGSLSSYTFIGIAITPIEPVALREVSMVVASWSDQDPPLDFLHYDYDVRIWSSLSGMIQSPFHPDVLHCRFTHPSNASGNDAAPPVLGWATSFFDIGTPSFVLTFDVANGLGSSVPSGGACPQVVLDAGHTYGFAIQAVRGSGLDSAMGQVDSLEPGPSDVRYSTVFPLGQALTDFSTPELPVNGRASYRIIGIAQSACPGDFNADGQVDDADFVIFAAAYDILDCSDPTMPLNCAADLSTDGFVDDSDFVLFAAAYDELLCP